MHPCSEKFDDSPSCGRSMAEIAEASDAQWEAITFWSSMKATFEIATKAWATPQIELQEADKNMVK